MSKKLFTILFATCGIALSSAAQDLTKFMYNYKVGYKDASGTVVVEPFYEAGGDFFEGRALVIFKGKRGFIDNKGICVVTLKYEDANSFHEGLAAVKFNGKYGFVDNMGKTKIAHLYDAASDFIDGVARVESNGQVLYINQANEVLYTTSNTTAGLYRNGLIRVRNEAQKWGYINLQGQVVIPYQYMTATDFYNGKANVVQGDEILTLDTTGKVIAEKERRTEKEEIEESKKRQTLNQK
jgi:hypothetical protein